MESRANRVTKDDNVDSFFYLIEVKGYQKSVKMEKVDISMSYVLIFCTFSSFYICKCQKKVYTGLVN